MERFSYGRLSLIVFDDVYKPAEDSFLLADMVKHVYGSLLEIGVGSGIVVLSYALEGKPAKGVDVYERAVENALLNAKLNNLNVEIWKSNLFSNVNEKFDWVAFNPPYLPPDEHTTDIDYATIHRHQIPAFLEEVSNYAKKGFFLILSSYTPSFEKYMEKAGSMGNMHIERLSLGDEELFGLRVEF